ncbi:putative Endonuclease III [Balamuthia mandrillaris]
MSEHDPTHAEGSQRQTQSDYSSSNAMALEDQQQGGGTDLAAIEQFFKQNDAIMEVGVLPHTKRYLSSGGTPQAVVQLLSESYRGYAQMCNLMCEWLVKAGVSTEEVSKQLKDQLKAIILEKFDPVQADSIFGEMETAPDWLDEMIEHHEWREMLYQLSEIHPNCLMLNFAIQRISDAGHQTEIASLTTASTNFGVFNRVLMHSLEEILQLNEDGLHKALPDFLKMCCHSQHTYFYTQAVLARLARERSTFHFKRLSQELEKATAEQGQIARKLSFMMSDMSKYPEVASAVSSIITTQATTPGDVIKLYKEYTKPDPPPTEFLRNPGLLDIFIRDMFDPNKSLNPAHKVKYLHVLAFAVSVRDERHFQEETGERGTIHKGDFAETLKALKTVQPICQTNHFGSELLAAARDLKENIVYPVVAMGVLHWIQTNLTSTSYYKTSFNTLGNRVYLELLREISYRHPLQRPTVLDVLVDCFEVDYDLDAPTSMDIRKSLMDNMIYLMKCGHVLPVLKRVETWAPKIDQALTRYFILQLAEMIEPPYSRDFVNGFFNVLSLINADALRVSAENPDLAEYLAHCADHQEEYHLEASHRELLATVHDAYAQVKPRVKIKLSSSGGGEPSTPSTPKTSHSLHKPVK